MNFFTTMPLLALLFGIVLIFASPAQAVDFPAADALPAVKELPDLLAFRDGSRVTTPHDWARRRAELIALIQHYEYGHLPPAGTVRGVELQSHVLRTVNATHKQYKLTCVAERGRDVSFVLDLLLPSPASSSAAPAQKYPVILRGDWSWHKTSDQITKLILARGYALAEFNRLECAPDNPSRDAGLYLAYPDGDFAALAAWAWGYSRCVDFLLTLPEIDGSRIAITGHSRGGKATLLAGALDERIALTNANASGCGGGAPFRTESPKSERLTDILKRFPFWFSPNLAQFIGREDRLPFDQHALKALCAPRAMLDTEGEADLWANPTGARVTHDAAKTVYRLLAAQDKLAIHYRPGKHEHNEEDWTALLDFADHVFNGKATARNFDMRPTTQPAP